MEAEREKKNIKIIIKKESGRIRKEGHPEFYRGEKFHAGKDNGETAGLILE